MIGPTPFAVVVDANALYPFTLRDTLLRAAAAGSFQLFWSKRILNETTKNLVKNGVMDRTKAERLEAVMVGAFPEAMVADHEGLIAAMPNHQGDRHVAAAAVKCSAQVIVTINLKHFQDLPDDLEAQHPDEFLCDVFDLAPEVMTTIVRNQGPLGGGDVWRRVVPRLGGARPVWRPGSREGVIICGNYGHVLRRTPWLSGDLV